jgi:hypothetical protein
MLPFLSFFQLDPFGPGSPAVQGLQVFQEHVSLTTQNWLTEWPIKACKGVSYDKPMLCSGTTVGTRVAMLKYLEILYEEMKVWIANTNCRFAVHGDDQSMHNHLFYSGQLPFATAFANREGGIVNTVGRGGSFLNQAHLDLNTAKLNISRRDGTCSELGRTHIIAFGLWTLIH